jgi:predicted small integral membrane protein
MMVVRLSKIMMTGGLAVWAFLVTLGNVTDYDSNWAFVQHVLSMDSIFPESSLKWRAITDPTIQRFAYLAIIVTEGLTCLAFLVATWLMARRLDAGKDEFQRATACTAVGVLLGFGLYFVGFMAIGGEWFAMWQSQAWNGQPSAFRFCLAILAVGIYVFLDTDSELERAA